MMALIVLFSKWLAKSIVFLLVYIGDEAYYV